ncbi:hypothetical protein [Longimicrobium sp.]|jgi:hypothetical protein|uniref:hypothetical protein n=1 Tax=Longimicrobium sp. TaxID=2029185 RepID=UPI002F953C7F
MAEYAIDIAEMLTTHAPTLKLLARLGNAMSKGIDTTDIRASELAFYLFEKLIASHVPSSLHPPHIESIAMLMDEKGIELERMRRRCRQEARKLVSESPTEASLSHALSDAVGTMRDEIAEIAELDQRSLRSWLSSVGEDPAVWATVSGLVGSFAAALPAALSASLAVTSFAAMGASAVKEGRRRRELLEKSPWSFVHFARETC